MGSKKIGVIRDWIQNYIQTSIINGFLDSMPVNVPIIEAVKVLVNLDKLSIVQYAIGQLGVYKFWAYAIYFIFLA